MGKSTIIGVIVAIVLGIFVLAYTNAYDVLKPEAESAAGTAKDAISQVDQDQITEKADEVINKIKDVTSKIELENPLETGK